MENYQRQDLVLPVTRSLNNEVHNTTSTQIIKMLALFIAALASLASSLLTTKTGQTTTLVVDGGVTTFSWLDVFGFSVICAFGAFCTTSIIPSSATVLMLFNDAIILTTMSALASLVSMILQPHFRWAAYSLCMSYTLALVFIQKRYWKILYILGGRYWKKLCSLGSQVLLWLRSRVDGTKEWLTKQTTKQLEIEVDV